MTLGLVRRHGGEIENGILDEEKRRTERRYWLGQEAGKWPERLWIKRKFYNRLLNYQASCSTVVKKKSCYKHCRVSNMLSYWGNQGWSKKKVFEESFWAVIICDNNGNKIEYIHRFLLGCEMTSADGHKNSCSAALNLNLLFSYFESV